MGFREVLQIPKVRKMWIAQIVSVFGDFLAVFAVFSDASFRLKAGPAEVSGVMITYLLPFAFVGPFAGVLVDRMDRKRIMIASDLIRAFLTLLLPFTTSLQQVYVIFLALSTVSAFFSPAQSATIRSLVPKEGLMSATALIAAPELSATTSTPVWPGETSTVPDTVGRPCWLSGSKKRPISVCPLERTYGLLESACVAAEVSIGNDTRTPDGNVW